LTLNFDSKLNDPSKNTLTVKNMKLIKLATMALATAGMFGVYNAGAAVFTIGVTTISTPLSVAITLVTNGPSTTKGDTTTSTTKSVKINNKWLISVFSHWSTNAFSVTGAKLVMGWDAPWYGDVLVVDKTGTNVLFDASNTGNESVEFVADFDDESGASTEKYVDDQPGSDTYTEYNAGDMYFDDADYYLDDTFIRLYGSSKVTFNQKWNKDGVNSSWNLSAMGMMPLEGDSFLDGSDEASAKATLKTNGSGKGGNGYWYD
jgi:hypothetical protein